MGKSMCFVFLLTRPGSGVVVAFVIVLGLAYAYFYLQNKEV